MQGTLEFMSHTARVAFDTPARYLQSPLDDLESFYWVALWAALRNKSVDMEKLTSDEIRWRKAICGNTQERLSLTVEIGANRDAEDLQKFNPVLRGATNFNRLKFPLASIHVCLLMLFSFTHIQTTTAPTTQPLHHRYHILGKHIFIITANIYL